MSEYQKDVIKIALDIVSRINADFTGDGRVDENTAIAEQKRVARDIATAIMAERQRCHDLVDDMAEYEGSDFGLCAKIMNGDVA